MSKVVIIADDLTGANATGVLLARQGFKCATFLDLKEYSPEEHSNLSIICISTDSRGIKNDEAYKRVKNVANFFKGKDVKLFAKRIDSTLRGNVGSEIDGLMDALSEDEIAVVVSAFPSSGRVTIGGYLMVNSLPLEKTDVAKDPKTPVHTSFVPGLIKSQSKYSTGFISLDIVLKKKDAIKEAILEEKKKGSRIIVIDATTNEDIAEIAKAVKSSGINAVSVDPGPFTSALAMEMTEKPEVKLGQKVMLAIGSVSNLTRKQIDELKLVYSPLLARVDPMKLIDDSKNEEEVNNVVQKLLTDMDKYRIIGVITTENENEVLNLPDIAADMNTSEEEISQRISNGLAKITSSVLKNSNSAIGGLYTSGGDVTVAVCKEFKSAGIEVKDEVLPLAVYGRIIKGHYDNMPIITKGGLIGDHSAVVKCVDYLLTKISNEKY